MASGSGGNGNHQFEDDKDCPNLLYLASQNKLNMEVTNRTVNSDTTPTLADIAKSAPSTMDKNLKLHPSSGEPVVSKTRDTSPSPPVETRMSTKARLESQRSFAEQCKSIGPAIRCPKVNCPEKIILCLDISSELNVPCFRSRAGDKFAPIKLVKRALEIFLHSKHSIDHRHEFALVFLKEAAYWVTEFSNDPTKIIRILKEFDTTVECDSFELSSIFEEIQKNTVVPKVENAEILPPPYTIRAIVIYGRSQCVPTFISKESQKLLQSSPHFFLDAYYVHDAPSEENNCEEIFDILCELDVTGHSYVFEASRNPTRLYDCMAQLLAHPLQRPLQKEAAYNLIPYTSEPVPPT